MKITNTIRIFIIVIITTFLFQVVGVPTNSYAQWVDRSDDLPGMSDDSSISPLIYVALGLVIVGIIYVIVKNKQTGDGKKEMDKPLEEKPEAGGDSSFFDDATEKTSASPIKLKTNSKDKTLVMGFSAGF